MEQVKEIKFRFYVILLIFSFLLPIPILLIQKAPIREYVFYFSLAAPLIILLNQASDFIHRREDFRVGMDQNGIYFHNRLGKKNFIAWVDLTVEKKFLWNGLFAIFVFSCSKTGLKSNFQVLYWANETSYSSLVKKYSPINHGFLKIINEYCGMRD